MSQAKVEQKELEQGQVALPGWYYPVSSLGIPLFVASGMSVPYAFLKQMQDNAQQGTKVSPFLFRGLPSVFTQQASRSIYRLGPIPKVREYAGKHHPEGMDPETAKNIASAATIAFLDVVIGTPYELIGTKQRTWNNKPGAEKPTLRYYCQKSDSVGELLNNLYGKNGATAIAVGCRTLIFIPALMVAKTHIDSTYNPKSLAEKAVAAGGAAAVGAAVSAAATPISGIQGNTSRHENPQGFGDAVKKVAGVGSNRSVAEIVRAAWKGAGSRAGLAFLGGAGVVGTITLQGALETQLKSEAKEARISR